MKKKKSGKPKMRKAEKSAGKNLENTGNRPDSIKKSQIFYYIGLGLVLVLIFFIRKSFLGIPFERDEGSYMYSGNTILNGAIPFKDIGSQRLDGVFYAYAVLVGIFGYTVESMHAAFIVINMASTVLLFFLAKKLCSPLAGIAAALFFALLSMSPQASGFTIQSEHIVAFLIIGAYLSLVIFIDSNKIPHLVLSGMLFSLAFQVKQTSVFYGVFAGSILLLHVVPGPNQKYKQFIYNPMIFSGAVIAPILVDLAVIYSRGAWGDFNLWFFDIRKQYTSVISVEQGITYLKLTFKLVAAGYIYIWIMSAAGIILVCFTKLPSWKKVLFAGINGAGFLTIVPGNHYYGHYFLQWMPAVAITGAVFIYSLQELLEHKIKAKSASVWLPLGVVLIAGCYNIQSLRQYYFAPNHHQILRDVYGDNPFPEAKVVADKLSTLMNKNDQLAVFGTEIEMYVYTGKVAPMPKFAGSGALLEFAVPQSKMWQKEFIVDVEKAAPKYLVFFWHPFSWLMNPKAENILFKWFDEYTKNKYCLVGFADMLPDGTRYVWKPDPALIDEPPRGKYKILVYERK